jgi:hypothetical protein
VTSNVDGYEVVPASSARSATLEWNRKESAGGDTVTRVRLRAVPALVLIVGALIVFSRRPDAFIHPQFWAEDGTFWYATAYNHGGLSVLFQPHTGYLQCLARLTAAMSMLFPVSWGPAVFVAVAVVVQVAPASFLVSERCSTLIASRPLRLLLAFLYLAIPNSFEVDANLTNAQWHLALLALLVVVAKPPRSAMAHAADVGTVVICGLSGPFAILLLPVACIFWVLRRRPWTAMLVGMLVAVAMTQLVTLFTSPRGSSGALGASATGFFSILGRQVFLGATVGQWGLEHFASMSAGSAYSVAIGLAGTALIIVAAFRVRAELFVVGLFGAAVLAASLASPTSTNPTKDWVALSTAGVGGRYWLIPMFAFFAVLVGTVDTRLPTIRLQVRQFARGKSPAQLRDGSSQSAAPLTWVAASGAVLVVVVALAVGVPRDWQYPPFVNDHFAHYAAVLAHARPGHSVSIPINPPGWKMTLVKRR